MSDDNLLPIKPYIIRAFYDWISDNQLTPYIQVVATYPGVVVPHAYVKDDQIVLNISSSAVGSIALGENDIVFTARFSGKLEQLVVPYEAVAQIFARENGAGTQFDVQMPEISASPIESVDAHDDAEKAIEKLAEKPVKSGKPSLKVVK